jgi:hypothetical protein
MTSDEKATLTGLVALQTGLALLEGYTFRKKKKRYNHMVSYLEHTAAMGSGFDLTDRYYIGEVALMASTDPTTETVYSTIEEAVAKESWMRPCNREGR